MVAVPAYRAVEKRMAPVGFEGIQRWWHAIPDLLR